MCKVHLNFDKASIRYCYHIVKKYCELVDRDRAERVFSEPCDFKLWFLKQNFFNHQFNHEFLHKNITNIYSKDPQIKLIGFQNLFTCHKINKLYLIFIKYLINKSSFKGFLLSINRSLVPFKELFHDIVYTKQMYYWDFVKFALEYYFKDDDEKIIIDYIFSKDFLNLFPEKKYITPPRLKETSKKKKGTIKWEI